MFDKKIKLRLIPVFIFVAFLSLSLKVVSVYDYYTDFNTKKIIIAPSSAVAKDKQTKDTEELTKVLNNSSNNQNNTLPTKYFTDSEIIILQELAERREMLDARAKEIDKRALQLKVAEDEIDRKIAQLKKYEERLIELTSQYNKKEKENIDSLVKLYTAMKPKDAARIFNTLDLEITVAILKGMKPSTTSTIISQMNSERAQEITAVLIGNNFNN
ncbi:MAG: hypothetical protein IKC10_06110 [Alphaproteobacteria bacterium]|nr:hypothetical protein [Alphaproteobacteria bacterium]